MVDVPAGADNCEFPIQTDHAVLSEHLNQYIVTNLKDGSIAFLISDVELGATKADFALTLRRCNFSFRQFEFTRAESGSGSGFLIASDKSHLIGIRDFQSIITAIAHRVPNSNILIISCESSVYVVSENDQRKGEKCAVDHNPTSAFTNIAELIGRWESGNAELIAIIAGYNARSRKSLGYMSGMAVQHNRKVLLRGKGQK